MILRKIRIGEYYTTIYGVLIEAMTCALRDDPGTYFDRVPKDWEYLAEQIWKRARKADCMETPKYTS